MMPTRSRALAGSGAWAVNRLASVLVPLALLPLLKLEGTAAMCAVMAATLVLSAWLLSRGQAGRAGRAIG
jgi:hypothetical protein